METRQEEKGDIIYGVHPVIEALEASKRCVKRIILSSGRGGGPLRKIEKLASDKGIEINYQEGRSIDKIAGVKSHQGVVALISKKELSSVEEIIDFASSRGEDAAIIVLDCIEDPRNLGAVVRSAEAFGIHGVVIPRHRSAKISPAVAKASAGAMEYMRLAQVVNLRSALKRMKERGLWIVGADARGEKSIYSFDFSGPIAIVVGGEKRGLRELVKNECDYIVSIPMEGHVTSLNAAVAASILIYEWARKRSKKSQG